MINIRTIKKLQNNDGLTLKNGKPIAYKSGWQVATFGIETKDAREALNAIKRWSKHGVTCGVWYSEGIYYVDASHRVSTKTEALRQGREYKQISILGWRKMNLVYC